MDTVTVPFGVIVNDFLGTMIPAEALAVEPGGSTVVLPTYPELSEDTFAWLDLLDAVTCARDRVTILEAGAGFGIWSIRGALAARQLGLPCRLISVEAEPRHFCWLQESYRLNGLDPADHVLIHGAISDEPGTVRFYVAQPQAAPSPGQWYGQRIMLDSERTDATPCETYEGLRVFRLKNGFRYVGVPAVTLASTMPDDSLVDLIHMDIQGTELKVIASAMPELNERVRRIHIGTHSREVEDGLRNLFTQAGWTCRADYVGGGVRETPYGPVLFQDGAQSWFNEPLRV